MKTIISKAIPVLMVVAALAVSAAPTFSQQDLRTTLFSEVDAVMARGLEARANILAPKNWDKAMERYNDAEDKLKAGKNLEDIRKEIGKAGGYFTAAIKATDLANVTLAAPLKARDDAAQVDAAHSAANLWQQAELKFVQAGGKLEDGKVNDARKYGAQAETLYRDAELSAIKTSFFDETRDLLAQAKIDRVEKYAPVSLARSRSLLSEAEAALNENRYDTDRPRSLAKDARYEVLHAMHLAKLVRMTEDKVMTREDLLLKSEEPLTRIGGAMDVQTAFDEGLTKPTEAIVAAIEANEAEQDRLASELRDREARITGLTEQIAQLETKLGGASDAQKALEAQVQAQEEASRRFARVEQLFTRDEARVLRQDGAIVIRLVGMNFASGKTEIRPDNFPLLTKLKNAIGAYPDADVSIEGHTDAYGTDEANLTLSQERADAVAQYLLANSSLAASRVTAAGFGESRPIANNETKEGRAKNRRIDVVITQTN